MISVDGIRELTSEEIAAVSGGTRSISPIREVLITIDRIVDCLPGPVARAIDKIVDCLLRQGRTA